MSELNEELLNDDADDFPEIGEADEDALLREDDDDTDVLNLAPEDEFGEADTEKKLIRDAEEKKVLRKDKFATERQKITAPSPIAEDLKNNHKNNSFGRQNNWGRGRGGRYQNYQQGRNQQFYQPRPYNSNNTNQNGPPRRNKTVLINPRFQGSVHLNNNAWDIPPQQYQPPNQWVGGAPTNMAPPMQGVPPQPHMPPIQGPAPPMQYQPAMQQYPGPPQLFGPMQHMNQGPPMQNMGPPGHNIGHPGQQMQFIPPQQGYVPQPLPPGVPQQPPMQGPNQQMMYMQNSFDQPPMMNPNQALPPMQPNHQFNNQFGNTGPPPMQQNFLPNQPHPVREVSSNDRRNPWRFSHGNMGPDNNGEQFTVKRKVMPGQFLQNKKRLIHERLGTHQTQIRVRNVSGKSDDRPSMVKEVTITTVEIQEDDQTRDLRIKIEEQRRKREQVLKWKEQRRMEQNAKLSSLKLDEGQQPAKIFRPQNRNHQQHINSSGRISVLHQIKRIDESHQPFVLKGASPNLVQNVDDVRVVVPQAQDSSGVPQEDSVVQLDEKHLSNFLADRTVLVKDAALMSTRRVTIKNIATSTGDKKIFQICKSIGEVQKLHRDKNERHATITFKSVASAHAFFKKYQRHMLDLSMIEVSLTPDSDGAEQSDSV